MENLETKKSMDVQENKEALQQSKETFEPLEIKVVDVEVEKGYATSGYNDPVTINQWGDGSW